MVSSIPIPERLLYALVIAENLFGYPLADLPDRKLRLRHSEIKRLCKVFPDVIARWTGSQNRAVTELKFLRSRKMFDCSEQRRMQ